MIASASSALMSKATAFVQSFVSTGEKQQILRDEHNSQENSVEHKGESWNSANAWKSDTAIQDVDLPRLLGRRGVHHDIKKAAYDVVEDLSTSVSSEAAHDFVEVSASDLGSAQEEEAFTVCSLDTEMSYCAADVSTSDVGSAEATEDSSSDTVSKEAEDLVEDSTSVASANKAESTPEDLLSEVSSDKAAAKKAADENAAAEAAAAADKQAAQEKAAVKVASEKAAAEATTEAAEAKAAEAAGSAAKKAAEEKSAAEVVKKYTGSFWHSSFGYKNYDICVSITSSQAGTWTTMEETLDINVACDGDQITLDDGATKLVGQVSSNRTIHGKVFQDGEIGHGTFRLVPEYDCDPADNVAHILKRMDESHRQLLSLTSEPLEAKGQEVCQALPRQSCVASQRPAAIPEKSRRASCRMDTLDDTVPGLHALARLLASRSDTQLYVDCARAVTITLGEDTREWHLWEPVEPEISPARQACGTYYAVRDCNGSWDVCLRRDRRQSQFHEHREVSTFAGCKKTPLFLRPPLTASGDVAILSYGSVDRKDPKFISEDAWRVVDSQGRWLIEARDLKKGPWIARTSVAEETDFRIFATKGVVPQPRPRPPLQARARFAEQAVQCHIVHMVGERDAETDILRKGLERIVSYGGPDIQVHLQPACDTRGLNQAEVSELQWRGVVAQDVSWDFAGRILGCALSHSDIWLKRARSTDPIPWIILEDDAELNVGRNLPHLLGESLHSVAGGPWDLVLLGAWSLGDEPVGRWVSSCNVGPIKDFFGTWAYAITQRGAQRALAATWGTRDFQAGVNGRGLGSGLDVQLADAGRAGALNLLLCMPQAVLHPMLWHGKRFKFNRLDYEFCVSGKLDLVSLRSNSKQAFSAGKRRSKIDQITSQVTHYRRAAKR